MKELKIGRETDCDIVLYDPTQNTSRHHATLEIGLFGKMYLTDYSQNGTYVNGILIPRDTRYPVTRDDCVSFARTMELNWKQVPRQRGPLYLAIGVTGVIVLLAAWIGLPRLSRPVPDPVPPAPFDTLMQQGLQRSEADTTVAPPGMETDVEAEKKRLQELIEQEKRRLQREREKERKRKEKEKAAGQAADSVRRSPAPADSAVSPFIPF